MITTLILGSVAGACVSGGTEEQNMIERINPETLPSSSGQSQVIVVDAGKTVYLSGQVALDAGGNLVGAGDFRKQTGQVLRNVSEALRSAGVDQTSVVKLTIYVVQLEPAVHGPVLAELLGDLSAFNHPTATLVSVAGLARADFMIEIEATAVMG